MKHLCLNLKRFDVPAEMGGVNRLAEGSRWAETIVSRTKDALEQYRGKARFPMYFPEAHVIAAVQAAGENSLIEAGCGTGEEFRRLYDEPPRRGHEGPGGGERHHRPLRGTGG